MFKLFVSLGCFYLSFIFNVLVTATDSEAFPFSLPVTPADVPAHYDVSQKISNIVWMTTKYPTEAKRRLSRFFSINRHHNIHILGDEEMDSFMTTKFANTSVLWAYESINPRLMAAKADIWRVATLWYYGGTYMDADSYLETPISEIISADDRFLFGAERNPYGDCYAPSYRLNRTRSDRFAQGRIVVNWLLMSAPKHPFLTQALYDVVDTIKQQYLKIPYLYEKIRPSFFQIICSTGPGLLTASISEVITKSTSVDIVRAALNESNNLHYRYVGEDWKKYGGSWKAPRSAGGFEKYSQNPHYNDVMNDGGSLLRIYKDTK